MTEAEKFQGVLQELFDRQKLCVVSTVSPQGPYTSLVAFWADISAPREIVFFTPQATRKFANLRSDPRIAVLLQNSTNQDSDFHRAVAVTGVGSAAEIDKHEHPHILQNYIRKHPFLEDFVRSPSCAMIRITVDRYVMVRNFQNVTEMRFDDEMDAPD